MFIYDARHALATGRATPLLINRRQGVMASALSSRNWAAERPTLAAGREGGVLQRVASAIHRF